jgi:predicted component of type VI protein secretion system
MIPLVVRVEDVENGSSSQFAFIRSPVRIGRSDLNDVPLQRPFVSTMHGELRFTDEEVRYVDLKSTNGSFLDGVQLEPKVEVKVGAGSELRIGTLKLTFQRRVTGERPAARGATRFALRASSLAVPAAAASGAPPPQAVQAAPAPAPAPAGSSDAFADAFAEAMKDAPAPEPHDGAASSPFPILDLPTFDVPAPDLPAPAGPVDLAAADDALAEVAVDRDLLYAEYRATWEHLRSTMERLLQDRPGPVRDALARRLAEKYDAARGEPQFQAMTGLGGQPAPEPVRTRALEPVRPERTPSPPPPPRPALSGDQEVLQLLRAFADSYLPDAVTMAGAKEAETVLGRVADVLETFARSFVELRRGYEEFGREMGLRTVHGEGAVHRVRDEKQLLVYVLDPRAESRPGELQRAFADFMVHQVALLNGVGEGGRALLERLSPESISAEAPGGMWPMRAERLWRAFEARFHAIADEESGVTDVLFGKEFARAYADIAGRRGADAGPEREADDDEDDDGDGPPRRGRGAR